MSTSTVDTDTDNLKPMSRDEMSRFMSMYQSERRIYEKAQTATAEQKAQLVATRQEQMIKTKNVYLQAVKFRPSYAPVDRPTKNESNALNMFWEARKAYRFALGL